MKKVLTGIKRNGRIVSVGYIGEVEKKGVKVVAELIDTFELAKRLKIHYQTLYTMIEDGKIPYIQLGERSKRFDYDEVVAHLRKVSGS